MRQLGVWLEQAEVVRASERLGDATTASLPWMDEDDRFAVLSDLQEAAGGPKMSNPDVVTITEEDFRREIRQRI